MPHIAYPVHLGIAYIFLVGYLVRTLFVSFRLPASVGVLISGFVFSQFFQDDLENAHATLEKGAFLCLLFEAGLDLTLRDLQPYIFVLAWLPWTMEVVAVAFHGVLVGGFTRQEALVLGTILSTVGPGLVMPKMKEFAARFPRHPLPRLMFTWAPLEGSMALLSFGFLLGLTSDRPYASSERLGTLVLANALRVAATLCVGVLLGAVSGWLISRRMQLRIRGQPVFTGVPTETFLMALAAALIAFGLGAKSGQGHTFVPLGFAPGSLFQSEMMVVAMGSTFASVADQDVLQEVESIMGGVWVFGQLILFSMLGSGTSLSILPEITSMLPVMGVGLVARLVGVFIAVFVTRSARGCEEQSCRTTLKDAWFCFLATLPRATLQAALGNVPTATHLFRGAANESSAEAYISIAARVYILCMALIGQTLLNTIGPLLLDSTSERPTEEYCKGCPDVAPAGTEAGTSRSTIVSATSAEDDRVGAIGVLAERHGVDAYVLRALLEEAQDAEAEKSSKPAGIPPIPTSGTGLLNSGRRRSVPGDDLVLSQFDAMGPMLDGPVDGTVLRRTSSAF